MEVQLGVHLGVRRAFWCSPYARTSRLQRLTTYEHCALQMTPSSACGEMPTFSMNFGTNEMFGIYVFRSRHCNFRRTKTTMIQVTPTYDELRVNSNHKKSSSDPREWCLTCVDTIMRESKVGCLHVPIWAYIKFRDDENLLRFGLHSDFTYIVAIEGKWEEGHGWAHVVGSDRVSRSFSVDSKDSQIVLNRPK